MVDTFLQRATQSSPSGAMRLDVAEWRQELLSDHAGQDKDHDGYLTLDELLAGPLATFDCLDENHDGTVTQGEMSSGVERCSSHAVRQ